MSCLSLPYIYQWRSAKPFRLLNKKMGHDKDEDGFQLRGGQYFHLLACHVINRSCLFLHMRLTFIVLFRYVFHHFYGPRRPLRTSRGIALLFLGPRHQIGVGGQPHAPTASTSGKYPVPVVQEAGWAPGPVWTGGEPRPHRDSNPDRPARSQSLYRLSYPAHYRPVLTLQNSMVIIFTIKFNAKYFSCRQQSKSIERSPSLEANTSSASQETPAFYGAETVFTAICPYPEPAQSNPCPHPTS